MHPAFAKRGKRAPPPIVPECARSGAHLPPRSTLTLSWVARTDRHPHPPSLMTCNTPATLTPPCPTTPATAPTWRLPVPAPLSTRRPRASRQQQLQQRSHAAPRRPRSRRQRRPLGRAARPGVEAGAASSGVCRRPPRGCRSGCLPARRRSAIRWIGRGARERARQPQQHCASVAASGRSSSNQPPCICKRAAARRRCARPPTGHRRSDW